MDGVEDDDIEMVSQNDEVYDKAGLTEAAR